MAEENTTVTPSEVSEQLLQDDNSHSDPKPKPTAVNPHAENISKALQFKQEGNDFFKTGDLRSAIKKYHHGLLYVRGISNKFDLFPGVPVNMSAGTVKPTDEQEKAANELVITLSNNLAACLMKQNEWSKVLTHTNRVLKMNSDNTKALYRRGVANTNLNSLDEAESDLKKAANLDPKDGNIRKHLKVLQQKLKSRENEFKSAERKMYSAMFS